MTKIIYAILADSVAKQIKVVKIDPDNQLQSAYEYIGCEIIEPAIRFPNGDVVYVDEEGTKSWFMFNGQLFHSRGLIVNEGTDDWSSPKSPVTDLFRAIQFEPAEPSFDSKDILAGMAEGSFKVMTGRDFDGFAGAAPGSLICWDFQGWVVIISPGNLDEEALSVHAYFYPNEISLQVEAAYELTVSGWDLLWRGS